MEPEAQMFLKGVYDELAEWDTTKPTPRRNRVRPRYW
jgi:hypothetical protein